MGSPHSSGGIKNKGGVGRSHFLALCDNISKTVGDVFKVTISEFTDGYELL